MLPSLSRRRSRTEYVCVESSFSLVSSPPHLALHHFTPSISISRPGAFTNMGWSGGGRWAPVLASCTATVERQRLGVHRPAAIHTVATVMWTGLSVRRIFSKECFGTYIKLQFVPLYSLYGCIGIRLRTAVNELLYVL